MHNDPIIVVGGGFAGLTTALALSNQRPRPQLLLIEPRQQFLFLPLLYELLSGEMKSWEVAPSYDSLLQGRRIPHLDDRVISINTAQKSLQTSRGQVLNYSQLVLATGSEPDDFGIAGVKEHALTFHSLADISPLKERVHSLRNRASKDGALVIVGAGATGVELACKLSDMLEGSAAIHLVELGDSVLSRSRAFNREQAQKALDKKGVHRHLNTRVTSVSANAVQLIENDLPQTLHHDGLIWTAGTKPVLPTLIPNPTRERGLLSVDDGLQLTTDPNVVVLGDVACHTDADAPWPRSAQSALQQGTAAARTLQAIRMGQAVPSFHFQDLGEMLSLGMGDASITGMGLTLAGPLAYRMRRLTYLARMPGTLLGLEVCRRLAGSFLKQAHLAGRTNGLRPSLNRQLERLSQRRHPSSSGADPLTLERLSELVLDLGQPLHLIVDERGLCRLLWVGPLSESEQLRTHLPGGPRRIKRRWRLISSLQGKAGTDLKPDGRDAVVALDLKPDTWLRFQASPSTGGGHLASLWQPDPGQQSGWHQAALGTLKELCDRPAPETSKGLDSTRPATAPSDVQERVLLLILTGSDTQRSERDLAELEGLVRSAGALPVAVCRQRQGQPNPQTLWGTGKLQEAALEARRHQATLVITDRELSPVQARNLELLIDCPVMDRSELILDIFAQRAASAAGRLQVELAQLRYRLPRLKGRGLSLSRQGGGIGTRGPGETQLEKDRRAISRRIEHLGRSLLQLGAHRARLRDRRDGLPRVALVGYTNAGKSSLLNALCCRNPGLEVLAENKLFATLDPTTRRLSLPQTSAAPRELLLTDTVGFIRELPKPLIEAFRATLEETREADVLLLVVDLADPDWQSQLEAVHQLLDGLSCDQLRKVVANQIDRCDASAIEAMRTLEPDVIYLSATEGTGLKGLRSWLEKQFWDGAPTPESFTQQTSFSDHG